MRVLLLKLLWTVEENNESADLENFDGDYILREKHTRINVVAMLL